MKRLLKKCNILYIKIESIHLELSLTVKQMTFGRNIVCFTFLILTSFETF